MEKVALVHSILKLGYLQAIQEIIHSQITALKENPTDQQAKDRKRILTQSFQNLADLCHFMESGDMLNELCQQEIVKQSLELLVNCEQYLFLGEELFCKLAEFLRELSSDNKFFCTEVVQEAHVEKMQKLCET